VNRAYGFDMWFDVYDLPVRAHDIDKLADIDIGWGLVLGQDRRSSCLHRERIQKKKD
jgi:hypothetical protein